MQIGDTKIVDLQIVDMQIGGLQIVDPQIVDLPIRGLQIRSRLMYNGSQRI
jgi:hypothetical protein